ncbi:MAG: caspase family protein [Rhodospirillaceae bacterium]
MSTVLASVAQSNQLFGNAMTVSSTAGTTTSSVTTTTIISATTAVNASIATSVGGTEMVTSSVVTMAAGVVPVLTVSAAPSIAQVAQTSSVKDVAVTVGAAIKTGSVHEAIAAMSGEGKLSSVEQRAVFSSFPTQALVNGLLASNNAMAKAVGAELKEVAAGNLNIKYSDVKDALQAGGASGELAKTYLGLFQAVQKEAKTQALGGALQELAQNTHAADLSPALPGAASPSIGVAPGSNATGTGAIGSSTIGTGAPVTNMPINGLGGMISATPLQFVTIQQVTVVPDRNGSPVVHGRIENWATGFDLSARSEDRPIQVADLGGGLIEDLISVEPRPRSVRLYTDLPEAGGDATRISGWRGGRQARIDGRWVFVRDDGTFEIPLPLNKEVGEVKLTLVNEQGLTKELVIKINRQAANTVASIAARDSVAPHPNRKIAILFANTDYQEHAIFANLGTPGRDAALISKTLHNKYGFDTRIVYNSTKQVMVDTFRSLHSEMTENDQLVVYYAGHGYLNDNTGAGYWLPINATGDSARNWVSTNDVAKMLRWIPARNIMVIADSCYSGAFTKEQSVISDGQPVNTNELRQLRGVMALSSGGDEPVLDGEVNSPFARALANRLNQVTSATLGEELFRKVRDDVTATTPQTPQYGAISSAGYDLGADYVFEARHKSIGSR